MVTSVEYECKTYISCNCSNLVYCLNYTECKLQYVGQTKRTILKGSKVILFKIKKADPKGNPLDETQSPIGRLNPIGLHFQTPNHDMDDVEISVLAFINSYP